MSTDNTQIVVPARTYLWLADVGATAPVDASTAMGTGWFNCGYTTPDSMQFSTDPQFQEVPSAQSDYPVFRFQTSESATVAVELLQWSGPNFKAAYGGGTVTAVTPATVPPTFKFVPPKIGERVEKAAVLETIMGAKHYRFVFPRALQMEGINLGLAKTQESRLPLSLGIQGGDLADPWYLLTDDPAFDPAAV